jgi:ribosomal protein L11 methyltransferase
MNSYFQVSLKNVPKNLEEEMSFLCFEHQALGVSENLDFNKKVYPEPEIIERNFKTLDAYFADEPKELITAIQEKYPNIKVESQEQEQKDWLAEWKKGFHAFALYEPFWIVPSWEEAPANCNPLFIDPGMAFGTGTHETTQICSQLICEIIKEENQSQNKIESLIDVGMGTGILAFLGAKMGVKKVLGTDNDSEALRVSKENAERNQVQMDFTDHDLPMIKDKFELVIANIIDGVLLKMKQNLIHKMQTGGKMILSGIIIENDAEFIENFLKDTSLKVIKRVQKGEWVGYLLA